MAEYTTLAAVHARMPELGTSDDALLQDLIFVVSAYFNTYTKRRFDSDTSVRTFTGGDLFSGGGLGSKKLFFRPPLATAPTLVRIRSNASTVWRTLSLADVKLMPEGRRNGDPILWIELLDTPVGTDTVWPSADDTVEVTGTWGLSTVPDDIREACTQTVINLYRARGSAGHDVEVGIGGTFMPDIPKAMPNFAYQVLRQYKRLVFA